MSYIDDTKKFNDMEKFKVRCKCSHTFILARVDRALCNHCGRWVYKNPEIEFRYKMLEKIKQIERDEKND